MAKYHINKNGEPGICRAKAQCPFGDLKIDHYSTAGEAREAFEKAQEKTFTKLLSSKKTFSVFDFLDSDYERISEEIVNKDNISLIALDINSLDPRNRVSAQQVLSLKRINLYGNKFYAVAFTMNDDPTFSVFADKESAVADFNKFIDTKINPSRSANPIRNELFGEDFLQKVNEKLDDDPNVLMSFNTADFVEANPAVNFGEIKLHEVEVNDESWFVISDDTDNDLEIFRNRDDAADYFVGIIATTSNADKI